MCRNIPGIRAVFVAHSDLYIELNGFVSRTPSHQACPLEQFLATPCGDMSFLATWPRLRKLFIELNKPLPESAACQRLFSAAGLIFKPLRACIGDANFEAQLLLKLNKDVTS